MNFSLVQSNKGTLFEICQYTGTIFPRPIPADNFIQNLNLMENNAGDIELLMLIESKLTTELLLKIFEFPSEWMPFFFFIESNIYSFF